MTEQNYEIREFGGSAMDGRMASDLTFLHESLLPHSPLVLMGPDFMRSFYYGLLPADDFVCGAVAYYDDAPAGFIVATGDANGFMSKATRRNWLRLGWIVLGSGPANIVVPENPGSYRGERPTAVATNNYEIAVTHESTGVNELRQRHRRRACPTDCVLQSRLM